MIWLTIQTEQTTKGNSQTMAKIKAGQTKNIIRIHDKIKGINTTINLATSTVTNLGSNMAKETNPLTKIHTKIIKCINLGNNNNLMNKCQIHTHQAIINKDTISKDLDNRDTTSKDMANKDITRVTISKDIISRTIGKVTKGRVDTTKIMEGKINFRKEDMDKIKNGGGTTNKMNTETINISRMIMGKGRISMETETMTMDKGKTSRSIIRKILTTILENKGKNITTIMRKKIIFPSKA